LWEFAAGAAALAGSAPRPSVPGLSATGTLVIQMAIGVLLALSAPGLYRAVARLSTRAPLTRP
jgi:hypothetical protein